MEKKFIVRAVRYEDDEIFGVSDIAICQTEEYAKMIVDALNNSDWSSLYQFGVIEKEVDENYEHLKE